MCISPYIGKNCKFYPSCSTYADTAIRKRGIFRGCIMIAYRIIRCSSLTKGGYDPVVIDEQQNATKGIVHKGSEITQKIT